jgi:hypothetical protein
MSKSQSTENIQAIMRERDAQRATFSKMQKEHDEAVALAQEIDAKIISIGEPNWRDPKKLDALASLKRQKEACELAIKRIAEFAEQRGQGSDAFARDGFLAIRGLLRAAQEALVTRITLQFEPFFATRARAREFAENSDAGLSAKIFIDSLSSNTAQALFRGSDGQHSAADKVEQLLKEALKPEADFEQYFRPYQNFTGA